MPSKNKTIQKAYKDGVISKGQYDKLSDGLLLGIIKKKSKPTPKTSKPTPKTSSQKKNTGATREVRHKLGKQAHKAGRPKGGSKVVIEN
tara:strand:+ start:2567 stop:2833 length:267 start_codon:yes stop_codon:yes gene_type:complete